MMPDNDIDIFMPFLRANGTIVLEGVAGIGKTHSIDKVRACLSNRFDLDALKTLLGDVITDNIGTPQGDNLTDALKKKQIALATLPEDQRANVCRRIDAKVTILVMHPSTSYEEMIGGLRPAPSAGGGTTFTWQPGKLTRAIVAACKDLQPGGNCRNHLIVLDEINRCNLPSVLGELIYLIEPSRRVDWEIYEKAQANGDEAVFLRDNGYSIRLRPEPQINPDSGKTPPQDPPKKSPSSSIDAPPDGSGDEPTDLFIPSNLFFLGTMNSSDRSILGFDQALRRRFPPYRLEPMTVGELLAALATMASEPKITVPGELEDAINAWGYLNVLLRCVIGPDAMIGHSYWFNALERHEGKPNDAWRFGVLPQAIHAAESARTERFLADIFDIDNKPDIESEYVNPERDEIGKARHKEAILACLPKTTPPVTTVEGMVAELRKSPTIVKLVGRGHGEKLIVVENTITKDEKSNDGSEDESESAKHQDPTVRPQGTEQEKS